MLTLQYSNACCRGRWVEPFWRFAPVAGLPQTGIGLICTGIGARPLGCRMPSVTESPTLMRVYLAAPGLAQ